jgi:hypothetical protein
LRFMASLPFSKAAMLPLSMAKNTNAI